MCYQSTFTLYIEIFMKIAVIGGVAAGKVREILAVGGVADEIEWQCEYEKPAAPIIFSAGFQKVIAKPGVAEIEKYRLKILERNEELRLFYVLESMEEDLINTQLDEYWCKSDILGHKRKFESSDVLA